VTEENTMMAVNERDRSRGSGVQEIRASSARYVWALDAERKRLERNLHDGAQQRLVSLSIALRQARARLATDPEHAEQLLEDAAVELDSALRELRELARGPHPAVLSEHGLAAALWSLVERAPFPVQVDILEDLLPEQVETAAYYIVSEALANASKHARATAAAVVVAPNGRSLTVEVADDGSGGADATGTGLLGLRNRAEAGGRFVQRREPARQRDTHPRGSAACRMVAVTWHASRRQQASVTFLRRDGSYE
jgi:signal transduction histidine kinase